MVEQATSGVGDGDGDGVGDAVALGGVAVGVELETMTTAPPVGLELLSSPSPEQASESSVRATMAATRGTVRGISLLVISGL
ncbi:MAG: hypothetical protein DRI30_00270 [Chloroflexi bacterium]|nr:MAG: hypothetical protein DRI30_00270 [Chloroflexota bacterium]